MRRRLLVALLAATVVKLVCAAVVGGTADVLHMRMAAEAFLARRDIFEPATMGFNPSFFPMGHYLLAAGSLGLSNATGWPFAFLVKVPPILADLAIALQLAAIPRAGARAAVWYMANPMTFLLSVYHGQFHTVALAGTLTALALTESTRVGRSGFLLGLAASVRQHFVVLVVPMLRRAGAARLRLLAALVATAALLNVWLLASAHPQRVLAPTWTYGSWGYTMLLVQGPRLFGLLGLPGLASWAGGLNQWLEVHGTVVCWAWAVAYAVWAWRSPTATDLWQAALVFPLGLCAVTPGFGIQWLLWAFPLWLIVRRGQGAAYGLLASAFIIGSYWQWQLNAKYGVHSITANLQLLSRLDLAGLLVVGALGLVTWLWCVVFTWRLLRGRT